MRKAFLTLIALSITLSLYSVSPTLSNGEYVVVDYSEESNYSLLFKALKEEVSLEWYENYTTNDRSLVSSSSEMLTNILPLSSFVLSEEKNNAIRAFSLTDGTSITFSFKEGKIHALSFN